MTVYRFYEPHFTGGHAVIRINEEEILKYMKSTEFAERHKDLTDEELIGDFVANNWCTEET